MVNDDNWPDETVMQSLLVQQIDSAKGLPLTCAAHQDQYWCGCRSKVITEGIDGPVLWHYFLLHDSQTHEVHVNITKTTVVRLTLYVEEWPTDRAASRMQVSLRGDDIAKRPPFVDDVSLTRLGWLNFNEGRGVLRELVMNRFASVFIQQQQECKSKYHGPAEHVLYLQSRAQPARAWDWDFATWYDHGVCPTCLARQKKLLQETLDANAEEWIKKAEVEELKPWEVPTDKYGREIATPRKEPLRLPKLNAQRKIAAQMNERIVKDFTARLETVKPDDEEDVPF